MLCLPENEEKHMLIAFETNVMLGREKFLHGLADLLKKARAE